MLPLERVELPNVGRPTLNVELAVTVCGAVPLFFQTTAGPFTVALYEAGLNRQLASGGLGLHVPSSLRRIFAAVAGFWVRM